MRPFWSWIIAFFVFFVDQLSKYYFRMNYFDVFSFFKLSFVKNTGAAFGLFQGYGALLIVVSIIASLVFAYYYPRLIHASPLLVIAHGLALGGVMGNLFDRVVFGYVTDFIVFSFWPAFNVADSSLCVAVVIFAFCLIKGEVDFV